MIRVGLAVSAAKASRHEDQKKSALGRFFFASAALATSARKHASRQFLPSREGFNYNTGHFGAGNTVARCVIKLASPRNCRQETYT